MHTSLLSGSRNADVEAQAGTETSHPRNVKPSTETEYTVPMGKKLAYLGTYFMLNLTLTIYNKAVLGRLSFPWLLTALHTSSASIGCGILLLRGSFTLTKLTPRENMILAMFSFLFTLNVAMSNVSLNMVSVPFHQIMRSTCPVATILLYRTVYSRTYSTSTYLSMIPLIFGVGLATYGDYQFTTLGFVATMVGVILAAVKTIVTNRLLTGSLKLPALELLLRMSPLAAIQSLLCAVLKGEMSSFASATTSGEVTTYTAIALLGNGLLAFFLNVSSFQTNKLAGALTISVCGNVKQCLTIIIGITLFNVKVGPLNGIGMAIALAGAAWYSKVELDSKGEKNSKLSNPPAQGGSAIQEVKIKTLGGHPTSSLTLLPILDIRHITGNFYSLVLLRLEIPGI
ncbi:TPT-domain-containing protein [Eremomyces bilateralis CBS 781.70]|uniref:TPT-domain-containing protein n=1 Tax=Eremomyces bilateralis CBS 781.70 TaxID=1392243 RepID=A0A6G1G7N2_9PEZI|nr:TPT-domain-containing protein [Eremomyces bilateralis CBS 781.70]KAF1814068.1 TPT-domain-containing protein [Eremomyces bilateralis CBS 781.70]